MLFNWSMMCWKFSIPSKYVNNIWHLRYQFTFYDSNTLQMFLYMLSIKSKKVYWYCHEELCKNEIIVQKIYNHQLQTFWSLFFMFYNTKPLSGFICLIYAADGVFFSLVAVKFYYIIEIYNLKKRFSQLANFMKMILARVAISH